MAEESSVDVTNGELHDIVSLLSSPDRDYLVRNNGDKVKIDALKGKKVGLYFSASWCGPCHRFTPVLAEAYDELGGKGDFEVVFVSADKDDEAFNKYFLIMPWLAIPFSDSAKRDSLDELFKVRGIPHLVIIDEVGRVTSDSGVEIIREYGVEGYPFTSEKIKELKDKEEDARKNQTLRSILTNSSRDFVVSPDGNKVPVSELEGKIVGIYFSISSDKASADFSLKLVEFYKKLKATGENFEVVMVPLDGDAGSFGESFKMMPWLSLPVKDKTCKKLLCHFEFNTLPTLVIIGADGKTLHPNVAEAVEEHGTLAYPFTPEKFAEIAEIEKAKEKFLTLASLFFTGELYYVIGKGAKVAVADLVGKIHHIVAEAVEEHGTLAYPFTPEKFAEIAEIEKAKEKFLTLESLFVTGELNYVIGKEGAKVPVADLVGKSILLYFSAHWCCPCLPKIMKAYKEIKSQDKTFEVIFISSDKDQASFDDFFSGMPWLALPFGDQRKASLSRTFKVQGIPRAVPLVPTGRLVSWSYFCEDCDYDVNPKCAFKEDKNEPVEEDANPKEPEKPEGWVCDGDLCYKP